MLGWKMFRHAVLMVLRNLGPAARIMALPVLAAVIVWGVVFGLINTEAGRSGALFLALPAFLITGFLFINAIVTWHRFILREKTPSSFLPKLRWKVSWSYIGQSIKIVLVILVISIVPQAVLANMMARSIDFGQIDFDSATSFGQQLPSKVWILQALVSLVSLLGTYLSYRWSPILPAAALEEKISMSDAWEATRPLARPLFGVTAIFVLLSLLGGLTTYLPMFGMPATLIMFVWDIAIGAVVAMLQISFITTVYGVAVEDRSLA